MPAITNAWRVPAAATPERHRDSTNALTDAMFNQNGRSMPGLTLPHLTMTGQIALANGTAAAPALVFASDPGQDSGLYYVGDNQWRATAGGQVAQEWQYNGTTAMALFADGTRANPSIGFFNDAGVNTGFWRPADDTVECAAGGGMVWTGVNLGTAPGFGVGIVPVVPFQVQATFDNWAAVIQNLGTTVSANGLFASTGAAGVTQYGLYIQCGGVQQFYVRADGNVVATTRLGVGIVPLYPFQVKAANATDFVAWVEQTGTGSTARGLAVKSAATGSSTHTLYVETAGTPRFTVFADGGVTCGATTSMGNGTLNVTTNLFKNGTAYISPDFAFEHAYTGRTDRYGERMADIGLSDYEPLGLDALEAYTREHWHFPYFGAEEKLGLFDGSERLLLVTEELALHLFALHHRVKKLEEGTS